MTPKEYLLCHITVDDLRNLMFHTSKNRGVYPVSRRKNISMGQVLDVLPSISPRKTKGYVDSDPQSGSHIVLQWMTYEICCLIPQKIRGLVC